MRRLGQRWLTVLPTLTVQDLMYEAMDTGAMHTNEGLTKLVVMAHKCASQPPQLVVYILFLLGLWFIHFRSTHTDSRTHTVLRARVPTYSRVLSCFNCFLRPSGARAASWPPP